MVPPNRVNPTRLWPATGLAWLLVLLLAVTTPLGLTNRAHQDQLLDPLFPHAHPGHQHGAHVAPSAPGDHLPDEAAEAGGPMLQRGAGAEAVSPGLGLAPLPGSSEVLLHVGGAYRQGIPESSRPSDWTRLVEAPPPRAAA